VIDPDKCTECVGNSESPQCAEVCPVDACVPDPDQVESREELLAKWQRLHPGEDSQSGIGLLGVNQGTARHWEEAWLIIK